MYCIKCGTKNEDDYAFCVSCGAPLQQGAEPVMETGQVPAVSSDGGGTGQSVVTEQPVVIPQAAAPAPPPREYVQPSQSVPPAPAAQPFQAEAKKAKVKIPKAPVKMSRRSMLIGGVILVGLVLVAYMAINAIQGLIVTFGPGDELAYIVQESGSGDKIVALMSTTSKGQGPDEVFSEPDGVTLAQSYLNYLGAGSEWLSPDGKVIALSDVANQEILLVPLNGSEPTVIEAENIRSGGLLVIGFSPDSQYFAYSEVVGEDDITMFVVDRQGDVVAEVPGYFQGKFLPNNRQMAVESLERTGSDYDITIDLINLPDGDLETELAAFTMKNDFSYAFIGSLFISPNGKEVYYTDDEGLEKVSVRGGESELVYDAQGAVFVKPVKRGDQLLLMDVDYQSGSDTDLYVFDPSRERKTRIDKYLSIQCANLVSPGFCLTTSKDESLILYVVQDSSGIADLILSNVDGKEKVEIVSGSRQYKFAFSPDGKKVAYIESDGVNQTGDLFISDLSGEKKVRIDSDVWSFRFVDGGRNLVYVHAEDLDRGRPESEIIRVRNDGKNRKTLIDVDDGLFTFVSR